MFPVVFGFLAIFGASAITSVDTSYIRLKPTQSVVMSGETFQILVYAYAHVPVNAVEVSIAFDPTTVEVLAVDKGQSVLTIWTKEPEIKTESIHFSGGTYRRGFVGEHLVATIDVRAKNSGQTEFLVKELKLLAGDGKGTPVEVTKDADETTESFVIYNQNEDPSTIAAEVDFGISADIDGDGTVTLKDISAFMSAWYQGQKTYDFNNDAKMNFIDFSIILARSFFRSSN
jgi:hypothetical protein